MKKESKYILLLVLLSICFLANAQVFKDAEWGAETEVYKDGKTTVFICFYHSVSSCEPGGKSNRFRFRLVGSLNSLAEKNIPCRFTYINCEDRRIELTPTIDIGSKTTLGNREGGIDWKFTGQQLIEINGTAVKQSVSSNKPSGDNNSTSQPTAGNTAKLKLRANTDCEIIVDTSNKGILKTGEIKYLDLPKGSYYIRAKAVQTGYEMFDTTYEVKSENLSAEYVLTIKLNEKRSTHQALYKDNVVLPPVRIPEMVSVESGFFTMGCSGRPSGSCPEDEKPAHMVTITKFSISRNSITVAQFEVFIKETGYKTDAEKRDNSSGFVDGNWKLMQGANWRKDATGGPVFESEKEKQPVLHISWNDANEYCKWLSKRSSGMHFRLPSEAEWEYAAKKNEKDLPLNYAGKLFEWCDDWYDAGYYSDTRVENPKGSENGIYRVLRYCATDKKGNNPCYTHRGSDIPDVSRNDYGFRVVRDL